jgi:putative endopeptidase
MRNINVLWAVASALVTAAAAGFAPSAADPARDLSTPHFGKWGFDTSGQKNGVNPGDDFFGYANGEWSDRTAIPADKASYGSFTVLADLSQQRIHEILEEAARGVADMPKEDQGKIGAFYKSFLNDSKVDALGRTPLEPSLAMVRRAKSRDDIARLMGHSADRFFGTVFGFGIGADSKNPNRYAVTIAQSGLGLPDRDYYLQTTFADKKAKYERYVARMLALGHWPEPDKQARSIVEFETRIAEVSWSRVESRDPILTYNKMTLDELRSFAPGFAWRRMLSAAGLPRVDSVIVAQKSAFPKLAAIVSETPLETLKAWEAFSAIDNAAPYLARDFSEAFFQFRQKELRGQLEEQARWRRAVDAVQFGNGGGQGIGGMGEAVGRVYVSRYFTADAKAKMEALVANLKIAFERRIHELDWMSDATKSRALEKLARYTVKIGYPASWRDYSSLKIRSDDLYGNIARAQAYEWRRSVAQLPGPVDKTEWQMTPQMVNAYNNPLLNEIVFPAAILQPPFFDADGDPAVNYGGIGGVIGHEMTHGFDDEGRHYDADGRLADWWTADDAKKFEAKAAQLAAEYSAFEVVPGLAVNGPLTAGENIADLGGLNLALDAYHASLKGQPASTLGGLTGDQRVFLGWAQVWRAKYRDDELHRLVVADVHSPAPARVDLPMANIDAWYGAFAVRAGQKHFIAPADRVRIW